MHFCSPITSVIVVFTVHAVFAAYVLSERNVYNKLVTSSSPSLVEVASRGLQPGKVNVAARARVWANATCGEGGAPEEFCRMSGGRGDQCGVCDQRSSDPNKRHLAAYAVDGSASNRWWQSPSLQMGARYQWVTLTLDLRQEYQVSDVIVKAAVSPRPGNWVLERSRDGEAWLPWHYFAISDDECWTQYGVRPAPPHPTYKTDTEVVCTSYYSKIKPLEGGEIHTNLVSGRPRVNMTELEEFTRARFVRLRLQKIRASSDFLARSHRDPTVARKLFYSISDIIISGQCICNGHASKCNYNHQSAETQCECEHNTCGGQCERCCPLFNQEAWQRGSGGGACKQCQCHGHASSCHFDSHVAEARLSLNADGAYSGGGVCDNCTDETTGINCEQCKSGWFRPTGVSADSAKPCVKCDCHSIGSTGLCANDDSLAHIGKAAGACECHEGFGGVRCDQCAAGYQGFPDCQPCPCDHRGTALHSTCDSGCQCKENVEGERCDKCKPGFFFLDRDNPKGCMECYCSGVSNQCQAATGYKLQEISSMSGWLVSDMQVKRTVLPSVEPESGVIAIGNFELPGVENYYWLAPAAYCGDVLGSYGSALTFRVAWVVMRGDTSGRPTVAPDVVILGNNGLKIGFGENWYQQNNISLTVQLLEQGWYHLANDEDDVIGGGDVTFTGRRFGFKGAAVTRGQMLSVLSDVKHILLRAKFHTDQAEASLVSAILETGQKGARGGEVSHVEECECPLGYAGLSCQSCDFGYTRITSDSFGSRQQSQHAVCSKCNCHSHAATCHPITGECGTCEHNTMGAMCERCMPGYYGDAQMGRGVEDCLRCACPLVDATNNFSPTCDPDSHGGYVCTQCPTGYQGNHCQECAPGYFGNPMIAGSTCEPCECKDGGPCDQLTGQCLRCHGNTEGWRCDRCKPAHYGNAHLSDCKPCDCDVYGSVDTSKCDELTGQCQCKDRYEGRSCNKCQDGLGNVTAGCVTCECDSQGSVSQTCDPVTGNCHCQLGVTGPLCNQCQPNHYHFSSAGCKSCDCHLLGSKSLACDLESGECACKDNVIGRTCDTCAVGFWGLGSDEGCQACGCDALGSLRQGQVETCDPTSGQCPCKPGVEGRTCDRCAPLFYGLTTYGCSECDICDKPGHICDPDTGRCVCPPFTEGPDCSRCQPNAWGYAPGLGCKLCKCDSRGSLNTQCNLETGECACADGFEGSQCSRCGRGFYNFPNCQPCDCDLSGTQSHHCYNRLCTCHPSTGQCPCKDNVVGRGCSSCKAGTFGLSADVRAGCLECFCFGRSASCTEAGNLIWQQLRSPHPRTLVVDYDNNTTQFAPASSLYPVNTREICYINLAVPGGGEMSLNGDDVSKWNVTNNLRLIPGDVGDVEIGVNFLFDSPLYWQLPDTFLKDKILSYGGFLRFTVETEGSSRQLPPAVLATYPLVQIQGNNKIILEHFPILHNPSSRHEVRFHESLWKMKNNPSIKVTRQMLMIALQNLQHILIRATDTVDFSTALLRDVTLDTAVALEGGGQAGTVPGGSMLHVGGVEVCACPAQYNATSCQNPSLGFYRYHGAGRDPVTSTIFIQLVGEARPCECNNRSTVCDIETGHCLNCSDRTGGERCERCAEGHYGDPERGVACLPCPCPAPDHNLAVSCEVHATDPSQTMCHCKLGYTGKRCERCSYGWYGYPSERDGACVRCECNAHGSVSDECHELTGQCNCRPGITGRDCSQCQPRHILTSNGCTSCDDGCTGLLLDKVDHVEQLLSERAGHLTGDVTLPPWQELMQADAIASDLSDTWRLYQNNSARLELMPPSADQHLHKKARQLLNKAKKLEKNCHNTTVHALVLKEEADVLLSEINGLENESKGIVAHLQSYGLSEGQLVSVVAALKEARQHLARIRDTDMEPNTMLTLKVLTYCNTTLNELKEKIGDKERLNSLKERLNTLLEQIADMKTIVTSVMSKSNEVVKLNDKNRQIYKNVGKTVDLSLGFEEDVAKLMRDSTELKNLASVLLGEAEDNIQALRRSSDDLKVLSKAVEEREGILFNLNPTYKEKYVIPAQQHANGLMEQAQKYAELFVPTRQDADFALKASKAYEDIVSALESAKQAARNASAAADIAHEQAYPGIGRDSLLDDASATGVESKNLLQDAKSQLALTQELHEQLSAQKQNVDDLRSNVTSASLDDNSIFRQLHKLKSDQVMLTADSTLSRADELTETAAKVKESADDIKKAVQANLKPQLAKLEAYEDISLTSAKDMIIEAQDNVKKAQQLLSDISSNAESHNNRFNAWNESVTSKLEALRNKITQARHIADGIRLSLTSRGERGSCIRTYQPSHLEPTTMTSIVLTYAISSQQRDALLFYLPSTTTDDFVAIEMVNRKMRFVWNMGGGVGEVTHPMHIQTAGDLSKDQHWYRVEAERISNVGRLLVRPQVVPVGSALAAARAVTNASAPGIGRLDVRRGDRVWVGGLPPPSPLNQAHPALLSTQRGATTGLVGCLHRLSLDGRPIGLWNFRTQAHAACTACIEGAEEVVEDQAFSFSGDSYAVLTYDSSSAYNKYVFSVSLSFRTLDENALLFHAVGDHPDRYISLTLREGHVVFRISYGSEWTLETRTLNAYNTGNWTRLEASRYFDRKKKVEKGVLKVEDESRDGSPQRPPGQDAIPDLSGARFFFGGLPPGYHPPPSLLVHHHHSSPSHTSASSSPSFLGCMSDVQVMQEGYNLLKGKFWGVQAACSSKPLTIVGFNGDGYLQLASHHLKRKASFGFVFATAQQDALLMLSTFEGLDGPLEDHEEFTNTIEQEQDRLNYYTASIRRGQIEVRLNAGRGEVRLASASSEYGDSQFHSVAVTKAGRRLELRVDDVVHATATLPEGATVVKAPPPQQGGLYFGGLPAHFNTTGRTITNVPLIGTIKDAIFNDQLLQFDQTVSFHHALIGRPGPNSMGEDDLGAAGGSGGSSEMAATMATHGAGVGGAGALSGCRKVTSYTLQPGAVKFGDTPHTHVQMNLRKRSLLQKNYTLELHFRTYYPDGLIFIVPGTPQKRMHYMMGALRNGRLQIIVKGRRKIEMTAQAVLNDGAWHHMILEKEDRKMTLSVDSIDPEKTKTPKKMNIGPIIYLGGVPEGATSLPESLVSKLPSFKGCMQGMKLNGHMEDLVGDKVKSHKVGQCFPQVERGSYFPGDAFAVYEKKFNVGNLLELELEFRTSEMNGILLSVSQPENYPALSLELHNGKVVMQGDMGDRRPFVVEQSLETEWSVCDNRWHRIHASIAEDGDQLTLRVDHHSGQKYWLSDNGHLTATHTDSPLYIGGLPDQVSAGMLRTRENFKGCIRNVMIGGERRDWTQMATLHNILLGSCPLPS